MQNTLYIPIDTTIDNPVECEKLVKRGDTVVLNIKVFNNGSLANLTGQSIDLILKKSDGTVIQKEIDTSNISGGVVTATLSIQATVVSGLVSGELQLSDSNGQNSTNTFTFNVSTSVADNVIEVSKNDINVLNELRQLIADGEAVIAQYEEHILAIANSIEAIEALENIKSYIDTNLAALENNNAQAVVNTNNLKVENDKAPGLTISLKAQNDAATSNISTLTTKNQEAVANKNNIDSSISVANTSKIALDTSNTNATNTKNALDTLNTTATNTKNALNTVNQTGQVLLNSLEEFEQEHADVTDISNQLANVNTQLSDIAINVKTFGAKGDSITDDTLAFQNAIDYCEENYKKLFIPDGTYLIGTVVIKNPIIIFGSGINTKIIPKGDLPVAGTYSINTEFGALFVIEKNAETTILSVEDTLDGVEIHDLYIYGNKRQYTADAFHVAIGDHFKFYNLQIEELKGSAFKFYQARECLFDNITIRYCGKPHLIGESEITKGHPTIYAVEKVSDNTNSNQFNNIIVACSYYTAIRMMSTTGNYFNNCFVHQVPPVALAKMIIKGLPDLDVDINGYKMNYEIVQFIDNLGSGKVNFINNCEFVWGGYNKPCVDIQNQVLYFSNTAIGGHWNATNDGATPNQGVSIKGVGSYLHLNNMQFNSGLKTFDLTTTKIQVKNVTDIDANLASYYSASEYIANNSKPFSLSNMVIKTLGGEVTTDSRYTCKKEVDTNNVYMTKISKMTDSNGLPMFEINGALFLESSTAGTRWDGHIWRESNIIKFKSNKRIAEMGDATAFYASSSAPTTNLKNGSTWFDTVNKVPKVYIDGVWKTFTMS
ncbi:BppU family phage baseplate upper protein [Clostridium beijerinckii]|uniref:BppU family phage baseplate upper protein n=1 Tax=Clostridium beijerinckii TaxID=1520 RepID=UPI0013617640|nr:BppU family phage baseplate upper protein [Clostridium beijerinckii]MZK53303.1 hypothetical protein [Clostridium beijerinckii]MZK61408.1 hypothetical protein [Clostridium beijerinckii]MZK71650.1 hypothetical protein [Clostridium beijerinckii]MZK77043.1 hypothetical protein [Clostridium beijerinckii]MZK86698.1 hypothetical protein [Clostridium beijerinckii]